jgi:hypothetical protein
MKSWGMAIAHNNESNNAQQWGVREWQQHPTTMKEKQSPIKNLKKIINQPIIEQMKTFN